MTTGRQRSAIVDGWRGISVALVILGHITLFRMPSAFPVAALNGVGFSFGTRALNVVTSLGGLGVSFFFAISGYLITSLLIAEESKHARVSLRAFYVRRVFRIMPAFYFYIASTFLLQRLGLISVNDTAFFRSAAYVCNFSGFSCSWWLAHTWSLAVEEQFYLTWPMLFVLAPGRRKEVALCLFAGLTLGSFLMPELGSFTYILIGVLVAVWPAVRMRLARIGEAPIWGALALLILSPLFARLSVVKEIVQIAQPLLVATVLFGTVFGSESGKLRAVIQHPILVKIGLVSYSLYLWQQLSLAPVLWAGQKTGAEVLYHGFGALLIVAFVPVAIASYFFLEKPLVAIGHRVSRRIIERDSKTAETEPVETTNDQRGLPSNA